VCASLLTLGGEGGGDCVCASLLGGDDGGDNIEIAAARASSSTAYCDATSRRDDDANASRRGGDRGGLRSRSSLSYTGDVYVPCVPRIGVAAAASSRAIF